MWLEMTNVFSSFWTSDVLGTTESACSSEGIGPHSERIMFGTDHPAGSGTLEEIYRTTGQGRPGESVRERLVGGTAERFVRTVWPDFDSRNAKKARSYAGAKPTDVVRSFAMSGRKRTDSPTASLSNGMSTIRPRIETPSLSRTTATA